MTDIAETLVRALQDDAQRREAGSKAQLRKEERAREKEAALKLEREAREEATREAARAEKERLDNLPPAGTTLSSARAIAAGRLYDTRDAVVLAANSPEWLRTPQVGDWAAMEIPHVLYRASTAGSYFERFHQRLTPLDQKEALTLYGALKHKLPFADAFPGLELEKA